MNCPGCGLTSATVSLLRGDWHQALHEHAFAPIFLMGFALVIGVGVLPSQLHRRAVGRIAALERRTGFFVVTLAALYMYWLVRLIL